VNRAVEYLGNLLIELFHLERPPAPPTPAS
jgi:hypothetical protein